MPEPFEPMGETLLRGGVAPVHVRRYRRELSDHLGDLVVEALTTGHSPAEAKAGARSGRSWAASPSASSAPAWSGTPIGRGPARGSRCSP